MGLSDAAVHNFAAALQGVVESGEEMGLTSPFPSVTPSLLNLCFTCRGEGYRDLPTIW